MSHPTSHCGDTSPEHRASKCKDCRRVHQAWFRHRQSNRDLPDRPICRSCDMRFKVTPPATRPDFHTKDFDKGAVAWLENAARVFDEESDELYTAEDFIAWLKPDMRRNSPKPPETGGVARKEGGGRKGTGNLGTRHTSPFPLPMLDRRSA
jgi:hypothetical protein